MKTDAIPLAVEEVRAVYAALESRLAGRSCEGRADCCRFELTGRKPYVTMGEALLAARAWRATGRTRLADREDGHCPFLEPGSARCLIYESRPFPCRTHFCRAAGGKAARSSVTDLIRRLDSLDRSLGGSGPRPLPEAVRSVVARLRG